MSRGSELFLFQRGQTKGRRLRFIPIPTPRWPDLVAIHSEEGERPGLEGRQQLAGGTVGARSASQAECESQRDAGCPAKWPNLCCCVPLPADNILFSSNFFSAHNASEALLPNANGGRRSAADIGA